jgi:hypothetical protein
MKKSLLLSVTLFTIFFSNTDKAQNTIHVPAQYLTIQEGINAASNGDTVLVADGLYYENVSFLGKAITVASHYLIDGDTTHIENTIIDGSNPYHPDSCSVVYFINGEDTNSVICGFTIRGGTGTRYYWSPGPVWTRVGGGILCVSSGARIVSNYIKSNRIVSQCAEGGGLCAIGTESFVPFVILERNRITDNYVQSDTVAYYYAAGGGADFLGTSIRVIGNVFERDTVKATVGAWGGGMSLYAFATLPLTSPKPTGYIKGNTFRANFVYGKNEGVFGAGIFLGWTGEVTILENLFEGNKVSSDIAKTEGGALYISDWNFTSYDQKIIIKNQFIGNNVQIPQYSSWGYWGTGGAIEVDHALVTISENEVVENAVLGGYGWGLGGGISLDYSSFRLENNIIRRNYTKTIGGGVKIEGFLQQGQEQVLANNTIVDNNSATNGGGLGIVNGANVVSFNNILWADSAQNGKEIYVISAIGSINYCDVEGGYTGTGNIDMDPLFRDTANNDFHLMSTVCGNSFNSPCIDAGDPAYEDSLINCDWGLGLQRSDIGTYGGVVKIVGVEDEISLPTKFSLEQNYPNPFNPTTSIQYAIASRQFVTLKVFDVLGNEIETLVNEEKPVGTYELNWNATNLPSGVYFYQLKVYSANRGATSFVATKKMILLR